MTFQIELWPDPKYQWDRSKIKPQIPTGRQWTSRSVQAFFRRLTVVYFICHKTCKLHLRIDLEHTCGKVSHIRIKLFQRSVASIKHIIFHSWDLDIPPRADRMHTERQWNGKRKDRITLFCTPDFAQSIEAFLGQSFSRSIIHLPNGVVKA